MRILFSYFEFPVREVPNNARYSALR